MWEAVLVGQRQFYGGAEIGGPRAAAALALLRPRIAVPIHWGTYRAGRRSENASGPAEAFARAAAQLAPEVRVEILPVAGTLALE